MISTSPELFYCFTLGMLAAVNPCGFPLLPAYLELFTGGATDVGAIGRAGKAVTAGAFSTIGFVLLFGAFGVVVELGWSAIADHAVTVARFLMVGLGVTMAVIGAAWLLRRPLRLRLPELRPGMGLRRPAALVVFGCSYGIASLGCALPLFVSGVATSFTQTSVLSGLTAFVAYALGMGTVLSALALVVALLGPAAVRPVRRLSRYVPVLGGVLLLVVGVYLTWYWLVAILDPTQSFPAETLVTGAQETIANFISANAELVGAVLGALVVGAILVGGLTGLGTRPPRGAAPAAESSDEGDLDVETPQSERSTP